MERIDSIFDIEYGNQLDLNKCELCKAPHGFNFVNRSASNCGVSARIKKPTGKQSYPAGCITVAMGGSVLASFVQQEPFFTGQNVKVLVPKSPMSLSEKLYYCACIEANRFRFSTFGREANASFDSILIPEHKEIPPAYINKKISIPFILDTSKFRVALETGKWAKFRLDSLFDIKKGKRLTKENMNSGNIPFIGATNSNNGQTASIGNKENLHEANLLTVSYNGSIAEAFFQPRPFVASDDINVLYPKFPLNKYIALFLCTIIGNEKYRFCYGRKWHKELMEKSEIKLPSTDGITPNWQFMEDYIKGLPYSDYL